jgi:hypothetical protein
MRILPHGLALLGLTFLCGCIVPVAADGAFSVEGSVVALSSAAPRCALQLLSNARVLHTREVSGKYAVTFIVAPAAATYDVQLHCNGTLLQSMPVHYGSSTRPGGTVRFPEVRA